MRISAAQTRPVPGDIEANVRNHCVLIELAGAHRADLAFFSELSLTGYEPKLAKRLAMTRDDPRLAVFQSLADAKSMVIAVGLPSAAAGGVKVSMLVFRPNSSALTYSKQQLHADELPFFVAGRQQLILEASGHSFAPAICYESLEDAHAEHAAELGADIYLASVAKVERNMSKAYAHYPAVARRHEMTVLVANCVGPCADGIAAGRSAIWNNHGQLVGNLDADREGIVAVDTATHAVEVHYVSED